jgi:type I restriction-modification system DNA methylase subunit
MKIKEKAKKKITALIARYEKLKASGQLDKYNEANTRKDFILPLFEALGWNIKDKDEVNEEFSVSGGSVDYAFRLNNVTKFFLEAKRFEVDLEEERWAEQAINYAWTKGTTWAVLSDFEGIKVFNAEWKESHVSRNIFLDLKYTDYLPQFDKLWLLSKESLQTGLIDKTAEGFGKKEKRSPVDEAIYADLIEWRRKLLEDIDKVRQEVHITDEDKEEAVQKILDRLIFIRSCEDRGIEDRHLQAAVREWEEKDRKRPLYEKIVEVFRHFYAYDSSLFEQGHLCEKLNLYDGTVKAVIDGLYFNYAEKIPYDFKNISADILGGIYEQYLGHILKKGKLVAGRPHRKERGIYYTPKYIVDYIVENTLGKLLKEIPRSRAGKIKILDPACGSGSFLIKALELMDNYYEKDSQFKKYPFNRRVKALQNNIYGVDLDEKAVEIAQLNLLLRALKDEKRALPDLSHNIKCGNSLISGKEEELKKYFGSKWEEKKPFNWEEQFPEVFKQGGFDIVIGNPPYVNIEKIADDELSYYESRYEAAHRRYDLYILFIERAINLLKNGGYFAFIIPDKFMSQAYGYKLRKLILDRCLITSIVDFTNVKVFREAAVKNVILILKKEDNARKRLKNKIRILVDLEEPERIGKISGKEKPLEQSFFHKTSDNMFRISLNKKILSLIRKVEGKSLQIQEISYVSWGAQPGVYKNFVFDESVDEKCRRLIKGENVNRYSIKYKGKYILYDPIKLHRPAFPELFENEKLVICAVTGDKGLMASYDSNKFYTDHSLNNLILKSTLSKVNEEILRARGIKLTKREIDYSKYFNLKYILGIINSSLMRFYFYNWLSGELNVYPENIRQLPIYKINLKNHKGMKMHDGIVKLVDKMLELNKKYVTVKDKQTSATARLKEEIERTDKKIDDLVYKLYGITGMERRVVEGGER